MRLEGKIALITGAGSGQGREAAVLFAQEGARVVVTDVDENGVKETVEKITADGGEAVGRRVDVADATQIQDGVGFAIRTYGSLSVLYNNAGVYLRGKDGPVTRVSDDIWDQTLNVNLKSMYLCCKYAIPEMIKAGGGAIVNTASDAGLIGVKRTGAYVASKHGVVGLTKTAALEYAKSGVRVNAVCPGPIETPMLMKGADRFPQMIPKMVKAQPNGRLGKPEEIAEAAVWLCSDAASFVTGLAMPVDGGYIAQ